MTTTILKEGVLNDDTLYEAGIDKVFSGGYVAILEYYTYANTWFNHKHVKKFKKTSTMWHFINKNYKTVQ